MADSRGATNSRSHDATSSSPPPSPSSSNPPKQKGGSILLRLWWMIGGSAVLAILAVVVLKSGLGWVSGPSVAMLVVAASMVAARWVDIHRFGGLTADSEPATGADFRRYAAIVATTTTAVWVAAHALG